MNINSRHTSSIRTKGTNLKHAKTHNHRVVLEVIRTRGPLSRAEVARVTSLSRQTIQNIVAELHDIGLVKLDKKKKTGKGRGHPGVDVHFRGNGGYALGLHIDQFSMRCLMTDLSGNIIWRETRNVAYPDPDAAAGMLVSILGKLEEEKPDEAARLIGVGLSLPGPFNVKGISSVGPTTLPRWTDPRVSEWLSGILDLPVVVENDASAAAVGEHLFGIGYKYDSFAYIYFGLGLGAGLHLNGALYHGLGGNAGEIGHMVIDVNGRECPCGNRGCLERYVSLQAMYDALGIRNPTNESIQVVENLFLEKDPRILQWLDEAAPRLRQAINILESILDASVIIVGGCLSRSILGSLISRIAPLHRSVTSNDTLLGNRVIIGSSGLDTTALGAAALAVFAQIGPQVDTLLKDFRC